MLSDGSTSGVMGPTRLLDALERRPRWVAAAVWLAVLAGCFANATRRGATYDFVIYLDAADKVAASQPVYDAQTWDGRYLYSPAFAVLVRPFTLLADDPSYLLWTALSLAALVVAVFSSHAAFRTTGPGSPWVPLLAVVLLAQPVTSNLRHGNSNCLPLVAIAVAALLLARGRSLACGFVVSLAAMVKLTPILFLGWFAIRRDRAGLLGALLGTLAWLVVLPLVVLGPQAAWSETRGWVDLVLLAAVRGEILEEAGQSVPQILETIAAAVGALDGAGNALVEGLCRLASAGILGLTFWVAWRRRDQPVETFVLLATALLLAQPVSRNGSFVLALPLVVLSLTRGDDGRPRAARPAVFALVLAIVLLVLGRTLAASSKALFPTAAIALVLWGVWVRRLWAGSNAVRPSQVRGVEARA